MIDRVSISSFLPWFSESFLCFRRCLNEMIRLQIEVVWVAFLLEKKLQDFVFTKHVHETCKGNGSDKNKREIFELSTRDKDASPSSIVVMFDVKAAEMIERVAIATFAAPTTPTAKYLSSWIFGVVPALIHLDAKSEKHHSIRTQLCLAAGHINGWANSSRCWSLFLSETQRV